MEELEKLVENVPKSDPVGEANKRSLYQRTKDAVTNYLVDVSAGLTFFNPLMAAGEYFIAGQEGPEVLNSRIGASIAQAICMRPSGILRNASANYFGLTRESPWYQKGLSDSASILALQIPAYSIALANAGVSLEEGLASLGVAVGLTSIMNNGTKLGFGRYMDFWRGLWGKKKAIK